MNCSQTPLFHSFDLFEDEDYYNYLFLDTTHLKEHLHDTLENYSRSHGSENLIQKCIMRDELERVRLIFELTKDHHLIKNIMHMELINLCCSLKMINFVIDFFIWMYQYCDVFLFSNKIDSWKSTIGKIFYLDDVETYEKLQWVMSYMNQKISIGKHFPQKALIKQMIQNGSLNIVKDFLKKKQNVQINSFKLLDDVWLKAKQKNISYHHHSIIKYFHIETLENANNQINKDENMFVEQKSSIQNQKSDIEILRDKHVEILFEILVHSSNYSSHCKKTLIQMISMLCRNFIEINRLDLTQSILKFLFHFTKNPNKERCALQINDRIDLNKITNSSRKNVQGQCKQNEYNTFICIIKHINCKNQSENLELFSYLLKYVKEYKMNEIIKNNDFNAMIVTMNKTKFSPHSDSILKYHFDYQNKIYQNSKVDCVLVNMIITMQKTELLKYVLNNHLIDLGVPEISYSYFYSAIKSSNVQIFTILCEVYKKQMTEKYKTIDGNIFSKMMTDWVVCWDNVFKKIKQDQKNQQSQDYFESMKLSSKNMIIQWCNIFSDWIFKINYLIVDRIWFSFLVFITKTEIPYVPLFSIFSTCTQDEPEVSEIFQTIFSQSMNHDFIDALKTQLCHMFEMLCLKEFGSINGRVTSEWFMILIRNGFEWEPIITHYVQKLENTQGDIFASNQYFEFSKIIHCDNKNLT